MIDITVELTKWNIHITFLQETIWNGNGWMNKKCMSYFVVQKVIRDDEIALHFRAVLVWPSSNKHVPVSTEKERVLRSAVRLVYFPYLCSSPHTSV